VSDETGLPEPAVNDSPEDFAVIVRRYQARVFAILHRYEPDAQRVEDLAQETFLKAWRARAAFDQRAPYEHWISKIAVRVALDHLRREKRRRNDIALPELGEDALDWLRSSEDTSEPAAREAAELLQLALRELSPSDRVVITLQELEGRSIREIAQTMGVSRVAVRVRALRARLKLRQAVEKWMHL